MAALSLLMRMVQQPALSGKKVLLLDADAKNRNDRTWCFWEKEAGLFENIVHHQWNTLYVHAQGFSKKLDIAPYRYKLIRGIDFYRHCFEYLDQFPNIHRVQATVDSIEQEGNEVQVQAGGEVYVAPILFNSIPPKQPQLKPHEYWLLQHFKGWTIETETDCFNPAEATMMDFRVGQEQGTTFVYVLPVSRRRALVEYTLFSGKLLPQEAYDAALKDYLHRFLSIDRYTITEEEFGIIPMTNVSFPQRSGNILNLGTAGGNTKGSSGYTFRAVQKKSDRIVASLLQHGHPFDLNKESPRFHFYDSVLLQILSEGKLLGADIFRQLFQKNKGSRVLQFLDNETSLAQEVQLLPTLPIVPFTAAAAKYLYLKGFK
ncbi:lycopene cyclase [Paracnuella aquatica]|nr:lycopene cyclase [Paracnuella aquatica]